MELLNNIQRALLTAVGGSNLQPHVYFTGGTLLTYYYLRHRRSLDLDFFSDELLDDFFVAQEIKTIAECARATKIRYVRFPSRWQYFLSFGREEWKFELAYFPFPNIGKRIRLSEFNLSADSLRDITVNKAHACFERDAPRDTFDLYTILTQKRWKLADLLKDVEKKFGVSIDLVHLAARLLAAIERLNELKPLFLRTPPKTKDMSDFFEHEARQYLKRHLR